MVWTFSLPYQEPVWLRQEPSSLYTFSRYDMKLTKYTEHQLRDAVQRNHSMRQTLVTLGVAPYGGNYDVLRKAISHFGVDTSHFTGQAWNRGKRLKPRRPINSYLENRFPIQSHKLRRRLIGESIFAHECSMCGGCTWLGHPIPLELDHINGDRHDNRLTNLRLLCPNCHATTPTYRGKNRSRA